MLSKFIAEEQCSGREVVLAGDWNASASFIQRYPFFSKLGLVDAGNDTPTCPTFLPWLKPLDHIFVPAQWSVKDFQAIPFGSDHLALLAEVEA
jgi:endonuclease/exonuclease/phosphatase family metal-dependent hydrolase